MKRSVFKLSIEDGEFKISPFNIKPQKFIQSEREILLKEKKRIMEELKRLNKK